MSAERIDWLEWAEAENYEPSPETRIASDSAWRRFLATHRIEEIETWAQEHRPALFKRWLAWMDEHEGDWRVEAELMREYLKREGGKP